MSHYSRVILLTIALTLFALYPFCVSFADDDLIDPGQITFREPITDTSEEQIDPYTGHLDLTYTDLHLPGDGNLDLKIIRTYKSSRVTDDSPLRDPMMGIGWYINFGKVKKSGHFVTIELQDGTISTAVRESLYSDYFYTKDFWKLHMPQSGTPELQLTDGTVITFGQPSTYGYLATEIRKNNNAITITYLNSKIDEVEYKAGGSTKTISFDYETSGDEHLQSITWGSPTRQITYDYSSSGANSLISVNLPGGDVWEYSYQQKTLNFRTIYILQTVTTPWEGTVTYDFATYAKSVFPLGSKYQVGVSTKQVSGRDLQEGTWLYDYQKDDGYDITTVTDSCGRTTTHTFYGYGTNYSQDCYKYGLPVSKEIMNGSTHELTTLYSWDILPDAISSIPYTVSGLCTDTNGTFVPVRTSETITRGGRDYTTEYSDFDDYGSPETVTEQGTNSKTTSIDYWYDTTRNIVKDKPLTITTTGNSEFPGSFTTTYTYYTNSSSHSNYYGNIRTLSSNGVTTSYSYNSDGNISSITDANNHTTSYQWSHGTVSRITNPYYHIQRTINWDGTVADETNGRGYTTEYSYDDAMRLTEISPPLGNDTTRTYEYDNDGYFTSFKEQRGSFYTRTSYDGLGRKIGTINSIGVTTSIDYSSCGLKNETSSNIGDTISYDHFGRPTSITHMDGDSSISFTYPDDLHRQITNEAGYVTHNYYSSFGSPDEVLLTEIVDEKNKSTEYSYNILGSLTGVSGLGRTDSYGYNSKNFLVSETHPESGTTTYTRDGVGNLETIQDSLGTRTYSYDDINRLQTISSSSGDTLGYGYDDADNLTSSQSPSNAMVHTYDRANRLTGTSSTVQGGTRTISYGYDGNDNLTSLTYPGGMTVSYGYNTKNQVTSISGFGAGISPITYFTSGDDIGLMRRYTRSNGEVVNFSYDDRRRPYRSTYPNTQLGYRFNDVGNLRNLYNYLDTSKDKSFSYDRLNRLTDFDGPWGDGEYEYNDSGNRTLKMIGGTTTTYSYSNHLLSGNGYSFNGDGDMTAGGGMSFEYDGFHHLKQVERAGSLLATYGYDADGQRVYKSTGGKTTIYVNNSQGQTLSELGTDGASLEDYIYLGDTMIAKVSYNRAGDIFRDGSRDLTDAILGLKVASGSETDVALFPASDVNNDRKVGIAETLFDLGQATVSTPTTTSEVFFYDTDYLGTPVSMCDLAGDVVWSADELPFGEEYEEDGPAGINTRRYIGKEKDEETGYHYFGARYMDSAGGRFNSADPVGLVDIYTGKINSDIVTDPQRLNRYAYGLNNPYRYVDPDGLSPKDKDGDRTHHALEKRAGEHTAFRHQDISVHQIGDWGPNLVAGSGGGLSKISFKPKWSGQVQRYRKGNMTAMEHITSRHGYNSGYSNVSKFSKDTSAKNIKSMINEAAARGTFTQTRTGSTITHDFGRSIGTNQAGQSTSRITIHLDRAGSVRTAYPY